MGLKAPRRVKWRQSRSRVAIDIRRRYRKDKRVNFDHGLGPILFNTGAWLMLFTVMVIVSESVPQKPVPGYKSTGYVPLCTNVGTHVNVPGLSVY